MEIEQPASEPPLPSAETVPVAPPAPPEPPRKGIKKLYHEFANWEYGGICLLLFLTLALHFSAIGSPGGVVFDEQHYVNDGKKIISGEGTERTEHPPLGKLFIVTGMLIFGDNPLGWRIFPVLFGTLSVLLFWLICRRLGMSRSANFLASFLFTFENLTFLQASVAMLDVFTLTFMLAAFWLYLRSAFILSGMGIAQSALTKLTGAFTAVVVFFHWLFDGAKRLWYFLLLAIMAPLSFFVFLPTFDFLAARKLVGPLEHIKQMLEQSGSLTFATVEHDAATRPWDWVLKPQIMFYWYDPRYIGAISFNIWALIIPCVIYMVIRAIKGNQAARFGLAWFIGTYIIWIPVSLVTDRVSYIFYFYPAVGAICLGVGLGLSQLWDYWQRRRRGKRAWAARLSVYAYMLIHLAVFVMLSPAFSRWVAIIPLPI